MAGTRLADPDFRKSLLDGGPEAIAACTDPLVVMARELDPLLREQLAVEWEAGEASWSPEARAIFEELSVDGSAAVSLYESASFRAMLEEPAPLARAA